MTLIDWIHNSSDRDAGLEFFKQHIKKPALYKVLASRDSPAIKARLIAELRIVAGQEAIKEVQHLERELEKTEPLAEELKPLEKEKSQLWRQSQVLKAELNTCEDKGRRCDIAHQILDNFEAINEMWAKINHWHKHKTLPAAPPDPEEITETDPVKLMRLRNNLRSNISKVRNKPDKIEKYRLLQRQLEEVEKRLKP